MKNPNLQTHAQASAENARLLSPDMVASPLLHAMVAAASTAQPEAFQLLRREFPLAEHGTLGIAEGLPENAFSAAHNQHSESPQA